MDGNKHIHLAPGNSALHCLLDSFLRKGKAAGQLDGAVQIAVVDGAQLHSELTAVYRFYSPAIAGHTLYHVYYPLFLDFSRVSAANPVMV